MRYAERFGRHALFGITDKGDMVGQDVSEKTLRQLVQELGRIDPPVALPIEIVKFSPEKSIIVVHAEGPKDVYTYDGRPYVRIGPTTTVMSRGIYQNLLMESIHASRRWETLPAKDAVGLEDLDMDEIQRTMDNAIRLGRLEPGQDRSPELILRRFQLIEEDRMLNAAVALFGSQDSNSLQISYPQFSIRMARFRGVDRLADFDDNRQYWGNAFKLLQYAGSFLMDHVPIPGKVIPGKLIREDRPLYPSRATREGIANAICHRDYAGHGGAVTLSMFNDRVEIANSGTFHFGVTPESLAKPHISQPWNPLIASVFYRSGIIERWGTGTLNILAWCNKNQNPVPAWKDDKEHSTVTLTFFPSTDLKEEKIPETHITDPVKRLLHFLDTEKSSSQLRDALNVTHRHYFRRQYIQPALEMGLIEYTIPEKPSSRLQRYKLTRKGRDALKI